MMLLICLFSPAFLAVAVIQKIWGKKFRGLDILLVFSIAAGAINMLSAAVMTVFFGNGDMVLVSNGVPLYLVFKYQALSFAFALVLPYVYDFLRRTVQIELFVQANPEALRDAHGGEGKQKGDEKE